MQTSLKHSIKIVGTGLHSGRPVRIILNRAAANTGIVFRRVDVKDRDPIVPARFDTVSDTRLNTRIANVDGVSVSTIEHLMAACAGCGLHNVVVDIDGPELPILDGSARRYVEDILAAGLVTLDAPIRAWRVRKDVVVRDGDVSAQLSPFDGLSIDFTIDFPDTAIGRQRESLDVANGAFVRELSDCRTFCRRQDIEQMRAMGLALGGTLENAIVVDGPEVLNPEGFRRTNECVRHKMLDALGDLSLAGGPVLGAYTGMKAGHGVTNRLLRKLFETPGAVEEVVCDPDLAERLPGVGLVPGDLAATA